MFEQMFQVCSQPDGFIQTDNPVFGGDNLLYFTASIDSGPSRSGLDMSTQERPLRKAIYAAVLASATRLNPFWMLLGGGVLGFAGLI